MANQSILSAFERMWQHVTSALSDKSDISHNHNDTYYTKNEIDEVNSTIIDEVNQGCSNAVSGENIIKINDISEAEHVMNVSVAASNTNYLALTPSIVINNNVTMEISDDGTITLNGAGNYSTTFTFDIQGLEDNVLYTLDYNNTQEDSNIYFEIYDDNSASSNFAGTLSSLNASYGMYSHYGNKLIMYVTGEVTNFTLKPVLYNPNDIVNPLGAKIFAYGTNICDIYGFSADTMKTPQSTRSLTNAYGTTISTIDPSDSITVTQTDVKFDQGSYATDYNYGYFCIGITPYIPEGTPVTVSFDLEILENPLGNDTMAALMQGTNNKTFTVSSGRNSVFFESWKNYQDRRFIEIRNVGKSAVFSNFQVEIGNTATKYEPCTPTEYTVNADGTVDGVISIFPTTTILSDTPNVDINCEYLNQKYEELVHKQIEVVAAQKTQVQIIKWEEDD